MKLMMFVIARYGIAAVMSPATASGSVGRRFDCDSSFSHVRLPSRMSPKRCTRMCPFASMFVSSPTFCAYAMGWLNGTEKLWLHSTDTFVLSLLVSL